MADIGKEITDKELKDIEKRLNREYKTAYKAMKEKADKYFRNFESLDLKQQRRLDDGLITREEYLEWRKNKMLMGDRYSNLLNALAADCTKTNEIAMQMLDNQLPAVYNENINYTAYRIEKELGADTSFTLYDRDTVANLVRNETDLLPKPKVDIPKDILWNKQHINSALLTGILTGDSIPDLSKRLMSVTDMNRRAAIRNSRTMVTGAQNKGRADGFRRAESIGVDLMQVWLATLDGRTRHSHRQLDGEKIKVGGVFSNGCRFPADPQGRADEVYNCRCTLIGQVKGIDFKISDLTSRDNKLRYMSYDEWKQSHSLYSLLSAIKKGKVTTKLNEVMQGHHISTSKYYDAGKNKSYFDVSIEELQQILNSNYGKGKIIIYGSGQIREVITLENDIGVLVDRTSGKIIGKTNRITVHYSKSRTHIVPAEKRK